MLRISSAQDLPESRRFGAGPRERLRLPVADAWMAARWDAGRVGRAPRRAEDADLIHHVSVQSLWHGSPIQLGMTAASITPVSVGRETVHVHGCSCAPRTPHMDRAQMSRMDGGVNVATGLTQHC
jgi:hypothetical protein